MASAARQYQVRHGCLPHEIEPGRSVVNDWDRALFEPWAERKARLATERAAEVEVEPDWQTPSPLRPRAGNPGDRA